MAHRAQEAPLETFYNLSFEDLNIIDGIQELWIKYIMWERSLLIFENLMDNAAAIGRFMAAGILARSMAPRPEPSR